MLLSYLYKFIKIWLLILCLSACSEFAKKSPEPEGSSTEPTRFEHLGGNDSTLTNLEDITASLNLEHLHNSGHRGEGIKVAIFDNGFTGLEQALGTRLPPHLRVHSGSKNGQLDTIHGSKIAEILYSVASGSVSYDCNAKGPELFLYNTNGFSNLRAAIQDAVSRGVHMIVYAQIWEFGGNLDGQGYIPKEIQKATNAGILWLNASGNYGKAATQGKIKFDREHLQFPDGSNFLEFTTEDETSVKITLAWNDFTEDLNYRTKQDLALHLYNASGDEILVKDNVQDGAEHPDEHGYSAHARESLSLVLKPGSYRVKVTTKDKGQFDKDSRYWIGINGTNVEVKESQRENVVFMPVNSPNVFAVGASDVDFSSFTQGQLGGRSKPEAQNVSRVNFSDGQSFAGTSAAVAIAGGALVAYLSSLGTTLPYSGILELVEAGRISKPAAPDSPLKAPELFFK